MKRAHKQGRWRLTKRGGASGEQLTQDQELISAAGNLCSKMLTYALASGEGEAARGSTMGFELLIGLFYLGIGLAHIIHWHWMAL